MGAREHIAKRLGYISLALVAAATVLVLVNVPLPLIPLGLVAIPVLYLYLAARRSFIAVGDGWWLTRQEAFGAGRWSTFDDLDTVRLRFGANKTPYVELRAPHIRGRFGTQMSGPVAVALARQVLGSKAVIDPETQAVLESWVGGDDGSVQRGRPGASTLSAPPRRRARTGGWQYLMSGVVLLLMGPAIFVHGWHEFRIHHDPRAVHVVATVDDVERQCGRSGCNWWSYGHYTVAGHTEEGIAVANERSTPARDPQTILVDPARPADVVNVNESPNAYLALGIGAGAGGALFVGLWAKPMIRKRQPQDAKQTASP